MQRLAKFRDSHQHQTIAVQTLAKTLTPVGSSSVLAVDLVDQYAEGNARGRCTRLREIIFGFFGIILLPIVVVVALAGLSGVLGKAVVSVADAESVNGFTLAELKDFELEALGGTDTQFFPLSVVVGSFDRAATTLAIGRDIKPESGHVAYAPAPYGEIVEYYSGILDASDWEKIQAPTPLAAFGEETGAVVWRKDNVIFRLVQKTDPRVLIEAGGSHADTLYEYLITPLYPVRG